MIEVPPPKKAGKWTVGARRRALFESLGGVVVGFVVLAKLVGVL